MAPTVSHHPNVEEDSNNDHLKKSFQRGYKGIIVVVDGEALSIFYSLRSVFFHFLQTCCNNDPRKKFSYKPSPSMSTSKRLEG